MTLILTHPTKPPVRIYTREDTEYHPGLVYISVQPAIPGKSSAWKAEAPILHRWLEWPDLATEIEATIGPGWTHRQQEYRPIPKATVRKWQQEG